MKLRIGTRGSALARAQADDVSRRLASLGHEIETVIISTTGDRVTDRAFTDVGAFGLFVRDIEHALLRDEIDLAVHSYKDVPSGGPKELVIAAHPERVDPADVLLVRNEVLAPDAAELPLKPGARVGTSAARRTALLRDVRPDLDIDLLRGNVPTRVKALLDGRFDAIVLAAAGLDRLRRADREALPPMDGHVTRVRLDPERFVPAPAQGAIAVQVRRDDAAVREAVAAIDDPDCRRALAAERHALALAEGGCTLPFGAWCREDRGDLRLVVALGTQVGILRAEARGGDPEALARRVWREVWEPQADGFGGSFGSDPALV